MTGTIIACVFWVLLAWVLLSPALGIEWGGGRRCARCNAPTVANVCRKCRRAAQ